MWNQNLDLEGLYRDDAAIRTYSGIYVDVSNPSPEDFRIEDIAHALSNQPRFGGHLRNFYSVAQHSIFCAGNVDNEFKLAALMHDASEAYLCDIPSPIKSLMPEYKQLEKKVMECIALKFGFKLDQHQVKEVDRYALEYEWSELVKRFSNVICYTQREAEKRFLKLFELYATYESNSHYICGN